MQIFLCFFIKFTIRLALIINLLTTHSRLIYDSFSNRFRLQSKRSRLDRYDGLRQLPERRFGQYRVKLAKKNTNFLRISKKYTNFAADFRKSKVESRK